MRHHEVSWADVAVRDLERILDFISEASPANARTALARLSRTAASLSTLPLRGRVVPELKWHGIVRYRELQLKPWRIIYRIEGNRVFVVAVLDSRRQLEDLLLDRFLFP